MKKICLFFLIYSCFCTLISCSSRQNKAAIECAEYCKNELVQISRLLNSLEYIDTINDAKPFFIVDSTWLNSNEYFKFIQTSEGKRLQSINFKENDSIQLSGEIVLQDFEYLENVVISYQNMASLYIESCGLLSEIVCQHNNVYNLAIKNCENIVELELNNNELTSLTLRNPKLLSLNVSHNKIKEMDIQDCKNLKTLNLFTNQLETLNIGSLTKLESVDVSNNQLATIDLKNNLSLKSLRIDNNKLERLNVSNLSALEILYCYSNIWSVFSPAVYNGKKFIDEKQYGLTELLLPKQSSLRELNCCNNNISELKLENLLLLETLSCQDNLISSIDVSRNLNLKELQCYNNKIRKLDLNNNSKLTTLNCTNNKLCSLSLVNNKLINNLNAIMNPLLQVELNSLTVINESFYIPDTITQLRKKLDEVLPDAIKFKSSTNNTSILLSLEKLGKYALEDIGYVDNDATFIINSSAIAIGKFFNNNTFAVIYCYGSNILEFYMLKNKQWKLLSKFVTQIEPYSFTLEKLRNDSLPVFVLSTSPNMNANQWKEAYVYKPAEDKFIYSGSFNTTYEVQLADSTIQTDYNGSWYMPVERTLYIWIDDELIPLKQLVLQPIYYDISPDERQVWYYENLDNSLKGLKLIKKEVYDEKKHQTLWNDFFNVP